MTSGDPLPLLKHVAVALLEPLSGVCDCGARGLSANGPNSVNRERTQSMTWDRFGYICRKASTEHTGADTVAARLGKVSDEDACSLYGHRLVANTWPAQLLTQLANMRDPERAERALAIYQRLNLGRPLDTPIKFKRALAYLSYVTLVFYAVAAIYQLKVTPAFSSVFDNLGVTPPTYLALYQAYWGVFVLAISVLILLALLSALQMRRLFQFEVNAQNRLLCRLLVIPACRRAYARTVEALQYPTLDEPAQPGEQASLIQQHLRQVEDSSMDLAIEIQTLAEVQMQAFLQACEKQLKGLTTLIAVVVIVAVMMFLSSAYSPIFSLGEAI